MDIKQRAFLESLSVSELLELIGDIYYAHMSPPKNIGRYNKAESLRLTTDNGILLSVELLTRCRLTSI
jgi:hypothetical protein